MQKYVKSQYIVIDAFTDAMSLNNPSKRNRSLDVKT